MVWLPCSAGDGGAVGVSGNGYTLTNITYSTFDSNTAAQTALSADSEGTASGGMYT